MSNGRYCMTKGYTDKDIAITEEFTDRNISSETKTLADLATTTSEVTSITSCLTDGTNCTTGTAFAIKVNNNDAYKFRVLSDENNIVTLIMSSNLYAEGNTTEPNVAWNASRNNADGPLTALATLKERTSDCINLEKYSYTLED